MKKIFLFVFLCLMLIPVSANALTIEYDGIQHKYTGRLCTLNVDGKTIDTPLMPPIIINDRTLIPVRELCEALGATVTYDSKNILIEHFGDELKMSIDKNNTTFNGEPDKIPDGITPKLINRPGESAKTMVPVRYIAEIFGKIVDFDENTNTVLVFSPSEKEVSVVSAALDSDGGTNLTLTVKANGNIAKNVSSFTLSEPTRIVFDIPEVTLGLTKNTITVSDSPINTIRFGYNNGATRIVFDVSGKIVSYKATKSGNLVTITVEAAYSASADKPQPTPTPSQKPEPTKKPVATATPKPSPGTSPSASPTVPPGAVLPTSGPVIVPDTYNNISKKIIVIDAGHGGDDPGAISEVLEDTVKEKNLTLSIAKKVEAILTSKGYSVVMTRASDTYPTLSERAELANRKGAAIFVSIHMNSATTESPNGTETYYSEINNTEYFGATSSQLAKNIQNKLYPALNSRNRGVKTANHAVTRNSIMPAALIEVGFISNTAEAGSLVKSDYQQKAAQAIAEGIIDTWKDITVPNDWEAIVLERIEALK